MDLFRDFSEVQTYIGANVSNELVTIMPYLDMAEMDYLRPVMGDDEYDALVTAFNAETMSAAQKKIIEHVQAAAVHFCYFLFANDGTMSITDSGFSRQEHSEAKSAYQWMTRDFKNLRWSLGWKSLEKLARTLYANMADFADWEVSDERDSWNKLPVWHTKIFGKYYRIDNWGTLWKLHPEMREYIDVKLKPQITKELYAVVMDEVMSDGLSADSESLLPYIERVVVMAALKGAVKDTGYEFGRMGLQSALVEPRSGDSDKVANVGRIDREDMFAEFERKEKEALNLMVNYLNANASATKYVSYYTKFINVAAVEAVDVNEGKGLFLF